jgi:DNA-binding protein HU-beta
MAPRPTPVRTTTFRSLQQSCESTSSESAGIAFFRRQEKPCRIGDAKSSPTLCPVLILAGRHDSLPPDDDSPGKEGDTMATKKSALATSEKAVAPPIVTLKHLAAELAEQHDLRKKQAEALLSEMVALATRHLKKGDRLRLKGLGILQVRRRPARMGRNPATGEAIKIKASKKVAFRPAKELREAI